MPQPLDAGLFSTVYQYVIISIAILIVVIQVSGFQKSRCRIWEEKRENSSSSLLSVPSFPTYIYREKERTRERWGYSSATFDYVNI